MPYPATRHPVLSRPNLPQTPPHALTHDHTTEHTMAEHNYQFNIAMSCGGCSGAVDRVLKKLDGAFPCSALCACRMCL